MLLLSFKGKADHGPVTLFLADDMYGTTEIKNIPVEKLHAECHRTSKTGNVTCIYPTF